MQPSYLRSFFSEMCLSLENLLYIPMRNDLLDLERWLDEQIKPMEEMIDRFDTFLAAIQMDKFSTEGQALYSALYNSITAHEHDLERQLATRYEALQEKHSVGLHRMFSGVGMLVK